MQTNRQKNHNNENLDNVECFNRKTDEWEKVKDISKKQRRESDEYLQKQNL